MKAKSSKRNKAAAAPWCRKALDVRKRRGSEERERVTIYLDQGRRAASSASCQPDADADAPVTKKSSRSPNCKLAAGETKQNKRSLKMERQKNEKAILPDP